MSRLIDADALIAEMHNVILEDGEDRRTFYEVIDRQPIIDLTQKIGKWMVSDDMYETGICSCCKKDCLEPVSYAITNFLYCPNCGAKMNEIT